MRFLFELNGELYDRCAGNFEKNGYNVEYVSLEPIVVRISWI